MIRQFIAANLGLRLFDFVGKSKVREYYKFYKDTFVWNQEQINKYQLQRLRDLLRYSYENVPFYKKRLIENNLTPDSIKSIEDFKKIPPLTREDLQRNVDDLLSKTINRNRLSRHSSSGTTGIPIIFYKDKNARSADIAATYVLWNLAYYSIGNKRLHIWGNPESAQRWRTISSKTKGLLLNHKNFPSYLINLKENHSKLINLINTYKPDYIEGYTSFIYLLAKFISDNKLNVHYPKRVLTTAESLYPYQKQIIENVLAPVVDYYGCGEINGIAIQCVSRNYHILEPRVLVEEEEITSSARQIILTDLENLSMPLIRYKVGDLIDGLDKNEKCECGLKSAFFRNLQGRTTELVSLPNGQIISPVSIFGGTAFRKVANFIRHQTIWNGKYFIFIFEVTANFSDGDKNILESIIKDMLKNYNITFKLKLTTDIAEPDSKFHYFKIDYDAA